MSSILQTVTLQQTRHREHRADAHLVGLAAGNRPALEQAHRLKAALLGFLGFHDHDRRRAVGELRRVARGDEFVRAFDRRKLGEALERGVGAIALIAD